MKLSIVLIILFIFISVLAIGRQMILKPQVKINQKVYQLEVANTPILRSQGLSERDSLSHDSGMIFIFNDHGYYQFHNRQMNFPIWVVWLNNNRVVGVDRLPIYDGRETIISPSEKINRVIELPYIGNENLALRNGEVVQIRNLPSYVR